jgi:peptidoglycan/xylan/chitin deacetylase (PgdA/CDA1 family)
MLTLCSRNPDSLFGLSALLDVERIPHRCVERFEAAAGASLLVAAGDDLTDSEIDALREQPAVVFHGGTAAARLLGAVRAQGTTQACALPVEPPLWPASICASAAAAGQSLCRVPRAPVCLATPPSQGEVLAWFAGGTHPAAVQIDRTLWCALDPGSAFTALCTESYLPGAHRQRPASRWMDGLRRGAEHAYYAAPEALRRTVQASSYRRLATRLERLGAVASSYPIDATGWLLLELLKQLLRSAGATLVRLGRWPAPYTSAATLTHDIEPRRYAYTTGLDRLLHATAAAPSLSTFGLVAEASDRHLPQANALCLEQRNVLCHGLSHRGEVTSGRATVLAQLTLARQRLEHRLMRRIDGYRSPRLDRSADLLWALDQAGFRYDSSYPDVDRENLRHFGGGVRFNLPYRPPIPTEGGRWRASRCLELPLTAPDCIQPLFAGASEAELHATLSAKAAFVRHCGGLYVALIHAGVFGDRDADRRERLLRHVHRELQHPQVWLAGLNEIVDWWTARESVEIDCNAASLVIRNHGNREIVGLRLWVDDQHGEREVSLPALPPGREAFFGWPLPAALGAPTAHPLLPGKSFLH